MKTAKEVLTKYSDGDYTQFQGYENILMAMDEYAKAYHESRMKEEFIAFSIIWNRTKYISHITIEEIDDYLATRKNK